MKLKSSAVLADAKKLIETGAHQYACAAIQDVETTIRLDTGENVSSKAQAIFMTFKPAYVWEGVKHAQQWWPKGDVKRLEALDQAIKVALSKND